MSDAKVIDLHLYRVRGVTLDERLDFDRSQAETRKSLLESVPHVSTWDIWATESEPSDG